MSVIIYQLPEQQSELSEALADPQSKHVWHDVPRNRWIISTGADVPVVEEVTE